MSIVFENVNKIYDGGVSAIKDLSLEIQSGEFIALIGESGSGKTTLLKIIAGITPLTSGNIFIDGILANNLKPHERKLAFVFQSYALNPYINVYENIAFGLKVNKYKKFSKKEIDERVLNSAEELGIFDLLNRKTDTLSGGQSQRVGLARAFVLNPKIFLFDEPLSSLDYEKRIELRNKIKELHKKTNATFIYVTHDKREAFYLADRIVEIKNGAIKRIFKPFKHHSRFRVLTPRRYHP